MNQESFEKSREPAWQELEREIQAMGERHGVMADLASFPRKFRQVCADLSLAEHRMYGWRLQDRLNDLVIRGYQAMGQPRSQGLGGVGEFLLARFPAAVRAEWRLLLACLLCFWGPFLLMALSYQGEVAWIETLLGTGGMEQLDLMYGNADSPISELRKSYGSNFMMFGFYIYNNIGIDLKCFAGGLFAGVGALIVLASNGLYMGAATGYIHMAASKEAFYSFVSGHSSWELMGAVISGMAGMRLGLAWLRPGRLTRGESLQIAAPGAVTLVLGAASLTLVAAFIEGFWSASEQEPTVKYAVGIFFWVVVAAYLGLAGLGKPASPSARQPLAPSRSWRPA